MRRFTLDFSKKLLLAIQKEESQVQSFSSKLNCSSIATSLNSLCGLIQERNELEKFSKDNGKDQELCSLIEEENETLNMSINEQTSQVCEQLIERSKGNEERDLDQIQKVYLEIRACSGGIEASLFASDLLNMYYLYSRNQRFEFNTVNLQETSQSGVKDLLATVSGENVFSKLKYESGVHRVQRVPITDTKVHSSTVSVAVLPVILHVRMFYSFIFFSLF